MSSFFRNLNAKLRSLKMNVGYISVEPMAEITKANLELLIREIQDLYPSEAMVILLESWIKGNDLHPEKIKRSGNLYLSNGAESE